MTYINMVVDGDEWRKMNLFYILLDEISQTINDIGYNILTQFSALLLIFPQLIMGGFCLFVIIILFK